MINSEGFRRYTRKYLFDLKSLVASGDPCRHAFLAWAETQGLAYWVYDQLKDEPLWEESERSRFKNLYLAQFEKYSRWQHEVNLVVSQMREAQIEPVFLKGYALAAYYPNPVVRSYQDIDFMASISQFKKMESVFARLNYSKTSIQNSIEKKQNFIKLLGHHTFAFEFHPHFYTRYKDPMNTAGDESCLDIPAQTRLFLGLVFHVRFSEISVRDLLDGYLMIRTPGCIDWEKVQEVCRREKLLSALGRYLKHLTDWIDCSQVMVPEIPVCGLKTAFISALQNRSFLSQKQRNWGYHAREMICTLLAYDSLGEGWIIFQNRYMRTLAEKIRALTLT